jgi:DDB1- and CUL4-associated factor 11
VKGPWCVDDMDSEAYISQFSTDGSLLVGEFRVCDFAIMQN